MTAIPGKRLVPLSLASLVIFVAGANVNVLVGFFSALMLVCLYLTVRTRYDPVIDPWSLTIVFTLVNVIFGGLHGTAWSWAYCLLAAALPLAWHLVLIWLVPRRTEQDALTETLLNAWDLYDSTGALVWANSLPHAHHSLLMAALNARNSQRSSHGVSS